MPKIIMDIGQTNEMVTRPVTFDVIRRICKQTGIPENTPIFFPSKEEVGAQKGSTLEAQNNTPVFNQTSLIAIEVTENFLEDNALSVAINRAEHKHLFNDEKLNINIRPIYATVEVSIAVIYRSKNKAEAKKWLNGMFGRFARGGNDPLFAVTYSYVIPEEFPFIINKLHGYREAVAPYGEDWDTYFKAHASKRLHWVVNNAGNNGAWTCGESQTGIVGWFDFEVAPEEPEREGDGSNYVTSFSYKFHYEKPIQCSLAYPLVVHNQVLPTTLRPTTAEQDKVDDDKVLSYRSSSIYFLSEFSISAERYRVSRNQGYGIPDFDEFVPAQVIPDTRRVFTVMLTIDNPTTPRLLFNLKQLGKTKITDTILDFIKSERTFVTKTYRSLLLFTLYVNNDIARGEALMIDEDLNVFMTFDPDLRTTYHVRLGLLLNLDNLTSEDIDRIREKGDAVYDIISAIDPNLPEDMPRMIGDKYIPRDSWNDVADTLRKERGNEQIYQFNTVECLFIKAIHNSELDN